jgi:hypothetical protein
MKWKIATAHAHWKWLAIQGRQETCIISLGGDCKAWLPLTFPYREIIQHPHGSIWAGADGQNLHIFKLEGMSADV